MTTSRTPDKRSSKKLRSQPREGQDHAATDPVRADILAVATTEFADKGLSGARVDEIAEQTQTSKRMIYYYFGSKEGLYRAVLERAYSRIRSLETEIGLDSLPPEEALRKLCEFTFDYHINHPEFVRLVMNENMLKAEHLKTLESIRSRNRAIVQLLGRLIERGRKEGLFRDGIDPINLHMSISALCFHNVANRYTFSQIFAWDMTNPDIIAERRAIVADTIVRWCRA